jgi:multiple sugar transport system substrate-binding protein
MVFGMTEGIHHWKVVTPRKSLATAEVIAASLPLKQDSVAMILAAVRPELVERQARIAFA